MAHIISFIFIIIIRLYIQMIIRVLIYTTRLFNLFLLFIVKFKVIYLILFIYFINIKSVVFDLILISLMFLVQLFLVLISFICFIINWINSNFIIYFIIFLNSFVEFWMIICILFRFIYCPLFNWQWLLWLMFLGIFIQFSQAGKILVHNKLKKSCQELLFLLLLRPVLAKEVSLHVSQVQFFHFIYFILLSCFQFLSKNF